MLNLTISTSGNITLIKNSTLCTLQTCDYSLAHVQYDVNLPGNSLFLAIFAALIIIQLGLGYRCKTWSFTGTIISGLILEVIGYLGRIMMHFNPFAQNPFLIELICLTIAPAFLTAALYLCLGRIVVVYGVSNSRFQPRTYTLIFCGCDLFSLVLQAIGGALAATASNNSSSGVQTGVNIMIAGLAFQVFSLLVFAALCGEFAWRMRSRRDSRNEAYLSLVDSSKFKAFLYALALATTAIFVRCAYRVAELQGGFRGSLANNQVTFMILEGTMIIIAEITMTAFHPGVAFQGHWVDANFPWKKVSGSERSKTSFQASTDDVEMDTTKEAGIESRAV